MISEPIPTVQPGRQVASRFDPYEDNGGYEIINIIIINLLLLLLLLFQILVSIHQKKFVNKKKEKFLYFKSLEIH